MTQAPAPAPADLPVGSIIMFYGNVNHLPPNWNLCDGTNNTVDLRDLFIVGAGLNYKQGDMGGADLVTLDVSQIPAHAHSFAEFVGLNDDWKSGGDSSPNSCTGSNKVAATTNTGGGLAHENRPPFFALAYIMKTS